jgi:hypothetical protein
MGTMNNPLMLTKVGVRAYEAAMLRADSDKRAQSAASFALSALVNVSGDHATLEELGGLVAELGRIFNELSTNRDLRGVEAVVEHLDNAHTAAMGITTAVRLCTPCSGSGEGRHAGRCLTCGGKGEVLV